ncbi:alpha/beta fold hydrolase, partial [Catenulispora pinisilvae]|uniref:alpha/beta fold hydrolase n=1 Tax=Catenulispora pinisilvae TaxID=2705253 RepID=UPI001E3D1CAA
GYTLRHMPEPEPAVSYFPAPDSTRLAYREVGEGRPLILLHGALGNGTQWLHHGHAEAFAARGHRVILPDFRGHGSSAKPQDAAFYPADVLADDTFALLKHLGLEDYDLGGYSLGARIVIRLLVRGAAPGRAVAGGQGMQQVLGFGGGVGRMLRRIVDATEPFEPGSPDERFAGWFRSGDQDPVALLHVLESLAPTPAEDLARVQVPTLVVMGTEDERAESVDALVAALSRATKVSVPGNHEQAAGSPEFLAAMLEFLGDGD